MSVLTGSGGPELSAVRLLYDELSGRLTTLCVSGSLTVGIVAAAHGMPGTRLIGIAASLTTAPVGSAAVVDVSVSTNGGTTYTSVTGGSGLTIPAGQTGAAMNVDVQVPAGSLLSVSILQIGSSTAGAGLTMSFTGGPF